jgi:exodeoxyribonuclease VII small subunit
MKKTKTLTYQEALQELNTIQNRLTNNEIAIDETDVVVQRAKELLAFCKEKLRMIEQNIAEGAKSGV